MGVISSPEIGCKVKSPEWRQALFALQIFHNISFFLIFLRLYANFEIEHRLLICVEKKLKNEHIEVWN